MAIIIGLYVTLPSINPSVYATLYRARRDLKTGKIAPALVAAHNVLARQPRMRAALTVMAEAHERMGKRSEALQDYFDYTMASERAGDHKGVAYGYSMIGWIYYKMGNYPRHLNSTRNRYKKAASAMTLSMKLWQCANLQCGIWTKTITIPHLSF